MLSKLNNGFFKIFGVGVIFYYVVVKNNIGYINRDAIKNSMNKGVEIAKISRDVLAIQNVEFDNKHLDNIKIVDLKTGYGKNFVTCFKNVVLKYSIGEILGVKKEKFLAGDFKVKTKNLEVNKTAKFMVGANDKISNVIQFSIIGMLQNGARKVYYVDETSGRFYIYSLFLEEVSEAEPNSEKCRINF